MLFKEILNFFVDIGNSIFSLSEPFLQFLSNTHTANGVTYSNFELLIGAGLIAVLMWGIAKWFIGLN